ncbi:MAG: hypothetical protein HC859_15380 [Bacteroidia bacterium]|nr:hypothetical protein [Bacteroidia bacterium]
MKQLRSKFSALPISLPPNWKHSTREEPVIRGKARILRTCICIGKQESHLAGNARSKFKSEILSEGEFAALILNDNIYVWIDCHVDFFSSPPTDTILVDIRTFLSED